MAGTPLKNLFPAGLCGATNRRGLPCAIRLEIYRCKNGALRCRYHGGLSTGPKTPEGKAKALRLMFEGLKRWRERRALERSTEGPAPFQPPAFDVRSTTAGKGSSDGTGMHESESI